MSLCCATVHWGIFNLRIENYCRFSVLQFHDAHLMMECFHMACTTHSNLMAITIRTIWIINICKFLLFLISHFITNSFEKSICKRHPKTRNPYILVSSNPSSRQWQMLPIEIHQLTDAARRASDKSRSYYTEPCSQWAQTDRVFAGGGWVELRLASMLFCVCVPQRRWNAFIPFNWGLRAWFLRVFCVCGDLLVCLDG